MPLIEDGAFQLYARLAIEIVDLLMREMAV